MSPSDPREPRLPSRAEALLEGWPAPSRGALDWEESASTIMNRVRHTAPGSTPDELLAAPLPEEPQENAPLPNPVSDAPRADASLAEIARAALAASDAASKAVARDGLIAAELGRKSPLRDVTPSPLATASASVAELQGRVAPPPPPVRRAEPKAPMTAVAADPGNPPVVEAAARSVHPAALSEERRRGVIPAIFGGSVLALAAAAALYISFERHGAKQAPLSASTEKHIVAVAPATAPAKEQPSAPAAAASAAPARTAVAMNDLEGETQAASKVAAMPAPKSGLAFHVKKETAPGAGKLVLEERDEASNAAPVSAAPVAQAAPAPAQAAVLAERPSTGAIQGAFGAVLTSARSCLAGQEEGTRAVVTFDGPTGRVKAVVLQGPGAGTPAEPCVRSALMGARLSPFSEPSYTASVTVRPL